MISWRWKLLGWWNRVWPRYRVPVARLWRPLLFRTRFIANCGSVGKTTTKEALARVLEAEFGKRKVIYTSGTWGGLKFGGVPGTILRVRPWHRIAIVEAAIEKRGDMAKMADLIKPDCVVMLAVKRCHMMEFKSVEGVATEKADMVSFLGQTDTAILNGDDPLVLQMREKTSAKIVTFGGDGNDVAATAIQSGWPEKLSFKVSFSDKVINPQLNLTGAHWVNSITAAIAAANELGCSTSNVLDAISQVRPMWARMQPITLGDGVTYLRDEFNGTYDTFLEAARALGAAHAERKIAVVSDYSDYGGNDRQRVKRLARMFSGVADAMIFIGAHTEHAKRAAIREGFDADNFFEAYDVGEAASLLKSFKRKGDLVLIKGRTHHHLSRVYLAQLGPVSCELEVCPRQYICDRCNDLGFSRSEDLKDQMAPIDVIV